MPMKVQVTVDGSIIEELEFTRLQALDEDNDEREYTYKVAYNRRKAHRTFRSQPPNAVYIKHRFGDGSLHLIRTGITKLINESIARRLP